MNDILIENGRILDGSGNPWFKGDIAIEDGKIAQIGVLNDQKARERIDAKGLIVAPGFIDIHNHSDAVPFVFPREEGRIVQGITTEIIGNCGVSLFPVFRETQNLLKKYVGPFCFEAPLRWDWTTLEDFFIRLAEVKIFSNMGSWIGHGAIRIAAMGFDNRKPTARELTKMKELVAQAMEQGAYGLSSGLIYPPGVYSDESEMIDLCKVVAENGGVYTTHMRNEQDRVIDSVKETVTVTEKSGVATIIAHHKANGRKNWGKSHQTLQLIDEARERGLDITCDVYPYIASSTFLWALLPPWVQEGGIGKLLERLHSKEYRQRIKEDFIQGIPGWANLVEGSGWDGILISSCKKNRNLEGKTLQQIADAQKGEPAEALFDILLEVNAEALMVLFGMAEEDVTNILKHPAVMVGSDAIPSTGKPHPRYFGAFPRILGKYVREDKALSLQEAVRKMSSMPAQKLGLRERGMIREGMWADVVIFDPKTIEDKATFANPRQYPLGIPYVLVNGQIAVREGKITGGLAGKVLRKGSR
jgi:N-acyl-D-amino-acid deacylase